MTVKSGAFNGISLVGVFFKNTQVKRLESGAFSERTLIKNVEFDNADLEYVDSNGLSAAVTKFSIKNSR